jgi:hypothetical protein
MTSSAPCCHHDYNGFDLQYADRWRATYWLTRQKSQTTTAAVEAYGGGPLPRRLSGQLDGYNCALIRAGR